MNTVAFLTCANFHIMVSLSWYSLLWNVGDFASAGGSEILEWAGCIVLTDPALVIMTFLHFLP